MLLSCLLLALQVAAAAAVPLDPAPPAQGHAQAEVLVEVRIHGNYATPDEAILAIAGLTTNQPFSAQALKDAEARLVASGRFDRVEVLKRFRSTDDPSQILAVILVDERAGATAEAVPGLLGRLRGQSMWAPILSFEDGYGFTYGARMSLVDGLGPDSRISVPLSWGGERQVAVDLERTLSGPIVSRVFGAVGLRRRENPYFAMAETRRTVSAGAERVLTPWLTAGGSVRLARVAFGDLDESHRAITARLTLDTRRDPVFPRNAVVAEGGWQVLRFDGGRTVQRWTGSGRGFIGLAGPAVLMVGANLDRASAPLPPYEQRLLGGASTLRGYRPGALAGDSLAAATLEVRVPLTSPLSVGRFGVKAFTDLGTVWHSDERLRDQRWRRGIGGGAFLTLTAVTAGLDVAWDESGRARAHLTLGVTF